MLVLVEGSLGGEHVPLVGFMLTLAAASQLACGNIFNKKIMSQATRPPIISLVVWSALIPVLPFMFASWLIDGPQLMLASLRQIDMLTVLSLYLAFIATLVGYGIWGSLLGRYETWRVAPLSLLVPVVGMASAALLLGETLSGLQLAGGGADHGRALYQRFRSASGAAWHGARVKKAPETGLYTSMRVMASQVVLLVVRHAKFVRFIIAGRHMIEIKRRVVMFRRENHCVTLVLPHRRGGLLRIAEAGCQRQKDDSCGSE